MMKKRAQAALEFLMTYGWAFLVILVMIGALAYFGVLSPKNMVPDKCTATAGFSCSEFGLSKTAANNQLILVNNVGSRIQLTACAVSVGAGGTGFKPKGSCLPSSTTNINSGDSFELTLAEGDSSNDIVGEKIPLTVKLTYLPAGKTIKKTATIELFGKVEG